MDKKVSSYLWCAFKCSHIYSPLVCLQRAGQCLMDCSRHVLIHDIRTRCVKLTSSAYPYPTTTKYSTNRLEERFEEAMA